MLEGLGQHCGALSRALAAWDAVSTGQWCHGDGGESSGETSEPQPRGSGWEEAQLCFRVDQQLAAVISFMAQ